MKLHYFDHHDFPPFSWLAVVSTSPRRICVMKGRDVEAADDFFVEGVWDGEFKQGGFDRTDVFFGSGMRVRGEEVVFVPSCATVDTLHYHQDGDHLMVSNSLPLLLAACGDRLDPTCRDYAAINDSIMKGIEDFERDIPTGGTGVRRLIYHNLVLAADGLSEVEKPMPPHFPDFEAYRDYLRDSLLAVIKNGKSRDRRTPMRVISSQSRGYDSTAINSLTSPEHVDAVFTIRSSRTPGQFSRKESDQAMDDSGEDICRHLGMPCEVIDSFRVTDQPDLEALLFAAVHNGEDANLAEVFERTDAPSIFLTGTLGEIWVTKQLRVDDDPILRRGDLSLHGMTEMRLQYPIQQVAVPFIGARRRVDICAITESRDQDPWRLKNLYDRPIPRRIAEEAGVPREMFGQEKMATATAYSRPPLPRSSKLRADYFRFLKDNQLASAITIRLMPVWTRINEIIHYHTPTRYRALYYLERLLGRISGRPFKIPQLLSRLNGSLFCYCVNLRADEYAPLVQASGILSDSSEDEGGRTLA